MRKVLVAAYDTEDQTDAAVTDLKAAGIPSTAIRRYAGGDADTPDTETTRSEQTPVVPNDTDGRTVVAVTVEHPQSDRVMDILGSHAPTALRDTGNAPGAAVGENVATPPDRTHPAEETLEGQQRRARAAEGRVGSAPRRD